MALPTQKASRLTGSKLVLALCLWTLAGSAWGMACDAVFTNGVQSHNSGGSVTLQFQSEVSGGSDIIDTVSLSTEGGVTCGGTTCVASGSPAASSNPTFITGNGSDGDVNAAGPQGNTTTVNEGDYGSINVVQRRRLNFGTSDGTYLMESLSSNFQSEIGFRSGDYWIDGDLTIGQETELELLDSGPVRIFVNGDVSFGFQAFSSGFAPDQLLIFATGNINLQNEVELQGFLYAGGQFQANFQSEITGAVSGANVTLANEVEVSYAGGLLDQVDFEPFCGDTGGLSATLVSYWTMDESQWTGTSGEVIDASGNGNNGTAQGDANTALTDPAIPGDPGTCGYGQFDGDGDFVQVPNLSETLNATASLAFWIKTTQTGDNTGWRAPGVAGIEQAGGTDDIFWGWLDASGRIGISVANDFGTKSTVVINDGSWHHVVLTRDHQAGEFQIFIDGSLNNSGAIIPGVIGNGYSSIGRIEDTAGTHEALDGQLDEVRVYEGVLSAEDVVAIRDEVHPCNSGLCPVGTPNSGLLGDYFDNRDLAGDPVAQRVDGPINFRWAGGSPGVSGIGNDLFSVRWQGRLNITQSGNYRFQTRSDDGVRLWVNGNQVIDNWTLHAATNDTSAPVFLEADQAYDIRLEYFENFGQSEIRLRWDPPGGNNNFTAIPAGPLPTIGAGLYHCPGNAVAGYSLSHSATGVTCEAEPVVITALDGNGDPVAPEAGTEIILGTSPAADPGWEGGNSFVFSGNEVSVTKFLRQTSPVSLDLSVTDGSVSGSSGPIVFDDVGLRFYADRSGAPVPNQVAGVADPNPVLRTVRTDDETGACLARVADETRPVGLGFECLNPGSCIAGQTLSLSGTAVSPNNAGDPPSYTQVNLAFDSQGYADIPLEYTDVGQVRLLGRMDLPEENEQPPITLTGTSNPFVAKPYTLEVVLVEDSDGDPNPGSVGTGSGFIVSGGIFPVVLEARNANGNATPNFGNEASAEGTRVELANLVYPSGGDLGNLSSANSFSPAGSGQARNDFLTWDNVGTITLSPRLDDDDYLGADDLVTISPSGRIGRFFPNDYALASSSTTEACGAFSYMGQPAIELNYTLNARNLLGATVSNYDNTSLNYLGTANPLYLTEDSDSGNGDDNNGNAMAFSERIQVADFEWSAGSLTVSESGAQFLRAVAMNGDTVPDGPWPDTQWGLQVDDSLDNRPLTNLDMNPTTSGDCTTDMSCTAAELGSPLDLRFGRLRLDDAFGPEVIDLPVPFFTEYWDGATYVRNADDSCTVISRSDIEYPDGDLVDDNNRTVTIGSGDTTGRYADLPPAPAGVGFTDSDAGHFFTAPGAGNTGSFQVQVDLNNRPWLRHDWDQDGDFSDTMLPPANIGFGSFRGHDRVIYWREVLE